MASEKDMQGILQDVHDDDNNALNVKLASDTSITIGEVDQGSKADAVTDAWYVQGPAADGAAVPAVNPVLIAGQDGTNVQTLKTDSTGSLQVDVESMPALAAGTNNIGDVDVATDPVYATVDSGEFTPGTSAAQFPTITCRWARIKARAANTGKVAFGPSGVTLPDGTTDTTTGFELSAGDDSGWIPVSNLNQFYGIGTGASDSVTYLTLA